MSDKPQYPEKFAGLTPPENVWRNRRIGDWVDPDYKGKGEPTKGVLHLAGYGVTPADVMFISPAVQRDEAWAGWTQTPRMLKGPAGNLFLKNLARAGFRDSDWYYTSLVKYVCQNNKPKPEDINWSKHALWNEIKAVKPKLVICLGKAAFDLLYHTKYNLKDIQGGIFDCPEFDCRLYPMDQVTTPLTKPEYLERFIIDLREAKRLLDDLRGFNQVEMTQSYHTLRSAAELTNWVEERQHQETKRMATDCEWHGQTAWGGMLRSAQFAWKPGHAVYVRLMDDKLNYAFDVDPETVGKILSPWWNNPEHKLVGHNIVADFAWFAEHMKLDIWGKAAFDTMYAMQQLNEYADLKLERLAIRFTRLGRYDLPLTIWKKENGFDDAQESGYGRIPDELLIPYGLKDVDATLQCWPILHKKLEQCEGLDYYNRIQLPFTTDGFFELMQTGVPVNLELLDEMRTVFTRNQSILLRDFRKAMYEEAGLLLLNKLIELDPDSAFINYQLIHRKHTEMLARFKSIGLDPESVKLLDQDEYQFCQGVLADFCGTAERALLIRPFLKHFWDSLSFNVNSSDMLRLWLFEVKGFTPLKTTKKDGIQMAWERAQQLPPDKRVQFLPSTDKNTIKVYASKDTTVAYMQQLKSVSNIVKAFLKEKDPKTGQEQGLHKWVQVDSRVHANFALTETGRPRTWNPNILNWPKYIAKPLEAAFKRINETYPEFKDAPTSLRGNCEAPVGHVLVDQDLKTAEVVALANISGDENMLKVLTEPDAQFGCLKADPEKTKRLAYIKGVTQVPEDKWDDKLVTPDTWDGWLRNADGSIVHPKRDVHWEFGEVTFGDVREKLSKAEARDGAGKVGNFSIPYQAGGPSLERLIEANTGIKPKEGTGEKMREAYAKLYPTAWRFLEMCQTLPQSPGYQVGLAGRVRHYFYNELESVEGLSEYARKSVISPLTRQACNFYMQNVVAETTALALLKFIAMRKELGLKSRVMMLLYDAITMVCPLEEAKIATAIMQSCLTTWTPWNVSGRTFNFESDLTYYFRWGVKMTKEQKALLSKYV